MEPRFRTRKSFQLVWMKCRASNENEQIPRLWSGFWPRHGDLQDRVAPASSYGVIDNSMSRRAIMILLRGSR
jgi:predicted transcriptional regulator YdeE